MGYKKANVNCCFGFSNFYEGNSMTDICIFAPIYCQNNNWPGSHDVTMPMSLSAALMLNSHAAASTMGSAHNMTICHVHIINCTV